MLRGFLLIALTGLVLLRDSIFFERSAIRSLHVTACAMGATPISIATIIKVNRIIILMSSQRSLLSKRFKSSRRWGIHLVGAAHTQLRSDLAEHPCGRGIEQHLAQAPSEYPPSCATGFDMAYSYKTLHKWPGCVD